MPRRSLALIPLLLATPAAAGEPTGNASLVALHDAGLAGETIAAKIRHSPCEYDLSTPALIALKRAGLPQVAIVALVEHCGNVDSSDANIPTAVHPPGIYLQTSSGETRVRPSAWSSLRIVGPPPGFGGLLFPTTGRLVIAQTSAQVVSGPRPVFLFRFDSAHFGESDFGDAESNGAQSPTEFSLVRFRVVGGNGGGSRQISVGRVQANIEVAGVDPQYTLPFAVEDLGNGQFRVEMPQALPPGQYGFVIMGERQRRRGTLFRIYDFAVK